MNHNTFLDDCQTAEEAAVIARTGSRDFTPPGVSGATTAPATPPHVSEEQFFKIFDISPDPMLISRLDDGRYLYVNQGFTRVSGYTPSEAIGRDAKELRLWAQPAQRVPMFEALLRNERVYKHEALFRIKSGEVRIGLFSAEQIDLGGVPAVLTVVNDITELKQAQEAVSQQAAREQIINRIGEHLRSSLDVAEIFRAAVDELGTHLDADRCVLFMIDRQEALVRNVAEYSRPGIIVSGRDFTIDSLKPLVAGIRRKGYIAIDDVASHADIPSVHRELLRSRNIASVLYVAVKDATDVLIGGFALSNVHSARHWREADIKLASVVAAQTGVAIRQAQLYTQAAEASKRENLINHLGNAIRSSLDLNEVLHTATHELGRALNASRTYIRLYHPAQEEVPVIHEYTAHGVAPLTPESSSFGNVFGQFLTQTQTCIVINDAANYADGSDEYSAHIRRNAIERQALSQVFCPVVVQGRFRGVLCIHQTDYVRQWTKNEVALVEAVAAQLATGIGQAELFEMVQRAKHEWETTFDAMSDGVFIFDASRRLVRANRVGAQLEDSYPHLLLGKKCCDILRAADTDSECIVERTMAEGRAVTIEVTPERLQRPLLVSVAPVKENGVIINVVCTVRDMSELREIEAIAREQQSLLVNILESAAEAIFAVDPRGFFQWCNGATSAISGYAMEDIIGRHHLELITEEDRDMARKAFEKSLGGVPVTYEARYHTSDGARRCALFNNAPLRIDGSITGVLGIVRDITEDKLTQERVLQSDKLRALGQLASGVAHDFNNSLAAIIGRAQLLSRQITNPRLHENLDVIQKAAEDAAATVRRIQTFASQTGDRDFEPVNVQTLLRDAIELTRTRWQNEARADGLEYIVDLDAPEDLPAMGSPSELREIFVNLIVNAIDAMPNGGQLTVRGRCTSASTIEIGFSDNGTGMSDEVRARIFEPFYTTKGLDGTGLGLFVSYGIVERHAGTISVSSQPLRGATFTITLPLETNPAPRHEAPASIQTKTSNALTILIVDDEDIVRATLADMATMLGHNVIEATNGQTGLELLATHDFDVVFTDLSMPGMDGWEFAREVKAARHDMKVVMITGYGATIGDERGRVGDEPIVDEIIGKPFDFQTIADLLDKIVDNG
ncbi:MAG: PAS domain S-box protein [Pyrinomonadaceae bacterium MAG19_C2-C3]|nr:PAS domain S-box protein [Pyrinomonadaceae bacterium MAG19_C2-C3]